VTHRHPKGELQNRTAEWGKAQEADPGVEGGRIGTQKESLRNAKYNPVEKEKLN